MWSAILLLCGMQAVAGMSEAEMHRLPRLFELDDYYRCLAEPNALYCLGEFRLTPNTIPHHLYDVLKEYSSWKNTFDRTLLHRGYCVTSRCPQENRTSPVNRFEACVQKWARPLKMAAHLETLHYCRGPEDRLQEIKEAQEDHSTHQLFLKITVSMLLMNVVGTIYDLMQGKNNKKHGLLLAWSVRDNWRRLVQKDSTDKKMNLNVLYGYRVFGLICTVFAHVLVFHQTVYTDNPQYIEKISGTLLNRTLRSITGGIVFFIIYSNFFLSLNLLSSKEKTSYLTLLPTIIVRRIARITPAYLYVLLFAVSWLPLLRDGPMWQLYAGSESRICRRKFWSNLFYVNNYVEKDSHCFIQTWYLAADTQLYLFGTIVTLAIAVFKRKPLPILRTMLVTSCILNGVLAYIYNWKNMVFISSPDDLRTLFKNQESFYNFYISTWGSLPSCIMGMYVAHKHYYEEVEGKKIQHSTLFYFMKNAMFTLIILNWMVHSYVPENNRLLTALSIALDRPLFSLVVAIKLYSFCKGFINGPISRFSSWHGFVILGRLSLSVQLLHWIVMATIIAGRSTMFSTSYFEMILDTTTVWVWTYGVAVPVTILIEMPVYRSVSAIC